MDDSEATSLEQIRAFLAGSGEVRFTGLRRAEVYAWTERTLMRHEYAEPEVDARRDWCGGTWGA